MNSFCFPLSVFCSLLVALINYEKFKLQFVHVTSIQVYEYLSIGGCKLRHLSWNKIVCEVYLTTASVCWKASNVKIKTVRNN